MELHFIKGLLWRDGPVVQTSELCLLIEIQGSDLWLFGNYMSCFHDKEAHREKVRIVAETSRPLKRKEIPKKKRILRMMYPVA